MKSNQPRRQIQKAKELYQSLRKRNKLIIKVNYKNNYLNNKNNLKKQSIRKKKKNKKKNRINQNRNKIRNKKMMISVLEKNKKILILKKKTNNHD